MIKTLRVRGLNGRRDLDLVFHPDINVVTGKNGSGKTTLLKLLWYLISGNFNRLFKEMTFEEVSLETSTLVLSITSDTKASAYRFRWEIGGHVNEIAYSQFNAMTAAERDNALGPIAKAVAEATGSSLFFPTFRRMEGGYAPKEAKSDFLYVPVGIDAVAKAMKSFADDMSFMSHSFVTSISTRDVIELVDRKFGEVASHTNDMHVELSEFITEQVRAYRKQVTDGQAPQADAVLSQISDRVAATSSQRNGLFRPFSVIWELTSRILKGKQIVVGDGLTFGEGTADAISSEVLSAGEKQMLSFLCYNTFYSGAAIIIDEPELSLHVDWQRILFPTLLEQQRDNQFIVATHSPFIFAKYSDKELLLDDDRGE